VGKPVVSVNEMIKWIAAWVNSEQRVFMEPTHFEVKDVSIKGRLINSNFCGKDNMDPTRNGIDLKHQELFFTNKING